MIAAVRGLFEAHLPVADLEVSIAFYRDRVGLELAHLVPARQAAFFWIGPPGHAMLGLWASGSAPQRVSLHVAFAATLEDVLAAPRRLQEAGITTLDFDGRPAAEPDVIAWMPAASVYFRDPDGHLLEYVAMLSEEPRRDEGVVRWSEWTARRSRTDAQSSRAPTPPAIASTAGPGDHDSAVRVLAISGSLRSTSSNRALVDAAVRLAGSGARISVYRELADIPPFNPDLDTAPWHPAVLRFRAALDGCDAVLISSPEYAHGVSGVLKNALDWIVGSGEFLDKPIALINASARAMHAHAALRETLVTMSGRVIEEASIAIPLDGRRLDANGIIGDAGLSALLTSALAALVQAASASRAL
jgi:NAD(P)H-dependent FMN reductase/catechol 2,3-dioxygenase-like lactoylglutathione lyase family enzyme